MSDDDYKTQMLVYAGRYLNSKTTLSDMFVSPDDWEAFLSFSSVKEAKYMAIGSAWNVPCNGSSYQFHKRVSVDEHVSEQRIAEWVTKDAIAKQQHRTLTAQKRLKKKHEDRWRTHLAPLREQYEKLNYPDRRVMQSLIIDWLEGH